MSSGVHHNVNNIRSHDPVRIGGMDMQQVSSIRDLQVYIHADMTHGTAVVRACYVALCEIQRQNSLHALVQSMQ